MPSFVIVFLLYTTKYKYIITAFPLLRMGGLKEEFVVGICISISFRFHSMQLFGNLNEKFIHIIRRLKSDV